MWELWWRQSQSDLGICDLLYQHREWAACCFFAQQAIEKSLKALARKPSTWDNLGDTTWDELGEYTIDQLGEGGRQSRVGHHLPKCVNDLHVWHRKAFQPFESELQQVERDNLNESTRYPPDARLNGIQIPLAPCDAFCEPDATRLRDLAHRILSVVRCRI